ncbi:MAG TPA: tetratricopeptide repeat protein [Sphingobacteriaceae bacterium]|nr:tetratricopeptide repeat protein [Sphingobacteriaceae bacterium]
MLNTKQIILIAGVIVLMIILYLQPLKSLVKEEDAAAGVETSAPSNDFTLENVSEIAKQGLNTNLQKDITDLEASLKEASEDEKLPLLKQLAQKWDDVNKLSPHAYALEEIAKREPTFENWLKTGDVFSEAFSNLQDTVMVPVLTQHAIKAYETALELDGTSLDAKTGLGSAYVNGPNPMQGITLLLEVVEEDPNNVKANFNLGLFSMQSRQFDKAVDRFKTVVDKDPSAEAWFYLATSYENIGLKNEAIDAFQKSKQLAADPSLSQFIDRKVEELSK